MTHREILCRASATLVAAVFSAQASAGNALFLANGPLGHLKKDDIEIARAAIKNALDAGPDGQAQTWSNPKTKASGTVKPTKTFTKDGMRCRTADFSTSAGGKRSANTWNLCNTNEGWKVVQ